MMPVRTFIAQAAARGITISLDRSGGISVFPPDARRAGVAYYVDTYADQIRAVMTGQILTESIAPETVQPAIAPVQSLGGNRPAPLRQATPLVRQMPEIQVELPLPDPGIEIDEELAAMGADLDREWQAQEARYNEQLSAAGYFAYLAARDNLLPVETLPFRSGMVITDPNTFLIKAVHRSRFEKAKWGAEYRTSSYTNFEADNAAIETIAAWYRRVVTKYQIEAWYLDHPNNPRNSGTYPWKGNYINGYYANLHRPDRSARTRARHTANRRALYTSALG